jgi:hypothetical protein
MHRHLAARQPRAFLLDPGERGAGDRVRGVRLQARAERVYD